MTNLVRWLFSTNHKDIGTLYFIFGAIAGAMGRWRDVLRESTLEGHHTKVVQLGLRYGFILFIVSEAMLFFALAGAAWSLHLPNLCSFNLLSGLSWFIIYLSIYIEICWGVFEGTKDWIRSLVLVQKSFLIFTFVIYIFCYRLIFPGEIEKGNLVNPLQVVAQLSCFLFSFKYPFSPVRVRHLLLMSFVLSLLSTLHLQGKDWQILSLVLFFFLILLSFIPLNYAYVLIFCGYFFDQGLAKWGFYLAFQQVAYYALSFFLEKEQLPPKKLFFSLILLQIIQLIYGYFYYNDVYLKDPLKLAALLSGACIIFLSLSRRTKASCVIAFTLYFLVSLFIGLQSSPINKTTVWGIPDGILIFFLIHFWLFLGVFLFKDSLPRKKQPLVPLFFSGLFFFLGYFQELAWLEKWIEGIDLLLLLLGTFSLVENSSYHRRYHRS